MHLQSNGEAHEICCALYAAGLHDAFDAVVDTRGVCFWPSSGFNPEDFGTDSGYGLCACRRLVCFCVQYANGNDLSHYALWHQAMKS